MRIHMHGTFRCSMALSSCPSIRCTIAIFPCVRMARFVSSASVASARQTSYSVSAAVVSPNCAFACARSWQARPSNFARTGPAGKWARADASAVSRQLAASTHLSVQGVRVYMTDLIRRVYGKCHHGHLVAKKWARMQTLMAAHPENCQVTMPQRSNPSIWPRGQAVPARHQSSQSN